LSVATVADGSHVLVKPVTIVRDLGAVVEIASGLEAGDQVIQNPPDGVANGDVVNVIGKPSASAVAASPASGKDNRG
jgi:hypothetical protein